MGATDFGVRAALRRAVQEAVRQRPYGGGRPVMTIELNTMLRNPGRRAAEAFARARAAGDPMAEQYTTGLIREMEDPRTRAAFAAALDEVAGLPMPRDAYRAPTVRDPLSSAGSYDGNLAPNLRISLPADVDMDKARRLNAVLGRELDQAAMAFSTRRDASLFDPPGPDSMRAYGIHAASDGPLSPDVARDVMRGLPDNALSTWRSGPRSYVMDVHPSYGADGPVPPDLGAVKSAAQEAFGRRGLPYQVQGADIDLPRSDYVEAEDYAGRMAPPDARGAGGSAADLGGGLARDPAGPGLQYPRTAEGFRMLRARLDARWQAFADEIARRHGEGAAVALLTALGGGGALAASQRARADAPTLSAA